MKAHWGVSSYQKHTPTTFLSDGHLSSRSHMNHTAVSLTYRRLLTLLDPLYCPLHLVYWTGPPYMPVHHHLSHLNLVSPFTAWVTGLAIGLGSDFAASDPCILLSPGALLNHTAPTVPDLSLSFLRATVKSYRVSYDLKVCSFRQMSWQLGHLSLHPILSCLDIYNPMDAHGLPFTKTKLVYILHRS